VSTVQRVWPVVLTADVLQNELLWDAIKSNLPDIFGDARVQALTLLDLPELEQMTALIEHGHSLADLLARKAAGPYKQLDFRRFVSETADLPNDVRSTLLRDRWESAMVDAAHAFGFEADRERIRRNIE
jgi:hypothetical protein